MDPKTTSKMTTHYGIWQLTADADANADEPRFDLVGASEPINEAQTDVA